jgi:hypothetical protein
MLEKELIEKLNSLKSIQPDLEIVKKNREILFSQILAGKDLTETQSGFFGALMEIFSINFLVFVKQPAFVTIVLIVVALSGGSVAGMIAARNAMPGDSLYIAKIISERTRSTITFNETDKAKLGVEFAGNRAKELSQVLAEPDSTNQDKEQKVAELSDNFKKEISQVKDRLQKITVNSPSAKATQDKPSSAKAKESKEPVEAKPDDNKIFRADTGKATSGIQIADPEKNMIKLAPLDAKTTLDEAEKLFDNKDLNGAIEKLEKVSEIIEKKDVVDEEQGKVKGESEEQATSTGK